MNTIYAKTGLIAKGAPVALTGNRQDDAFEVSLCPAGGRPHAITTGPTGVYDPANPSPAGWLCVPQRVLVVGPITVGTDITPNGDRRFKARGPGDIVAGFVIADLGFDAWLAAFCIGA